MSTLYRFVVDAVTDDELSPYRAQQLAKELSDNLHVTVVEPEDGVNLRVEKLHLVHLHDATEETGGGYCQDCVNVGYDGRNGDWVVEESE